MKLELICVVSLRTKSEEKLPLDNILLFLSFEIACSYDLFNMTALSGENPKRRNPEHRGTEGPTHRWIKTPKSHDTSHRPYSRQVTERMACNVVIHPPPSVLVGVSVSYPTRAVAQLLGESRAYDTSYPSLRRNIISYCCRVMSYWYIISLWYII